MSVAIQSAADGITKKNCFISSGAENLARCDRRPAVNVTAVPGGGDSLDRARFVAGQLEASVHRFELCGGVNKLCSLFIFIFFYLFSEKRFSFFIQRFSEQGCLEVRCINRDRKGEKVREKAVSADSMVIAR